MDGIGSARPRLLRLGNTMLLSGGRMAGVGGFGGWDARLWVSTGSAASSWRMHSISYHHNRGVARSLNASFAFLPAINDSKSWPWGTTSYTSLVRRTVVAGCWDLGGAPRRLQAETVRTGAAGRPPRPRRLRHGAADLRVVLD